MKNLETIIVSNFPMNIIIHAFLENSMLEEIKAHHTQKKKDRKESTLNYGFCQLEAKLLYFIYVYFMYSYID